MKLSKNFRYLYFATASGIFYISLSDFPQSRQPKILLHQQGAGAGLSLDSSLSFLLYIAVNSTIYEHDLITRTTTETRNSKLHPGTRRDHSGVTSLTSHNGRHWWISQSCSKEENSEGSCMFGEEETGGDIQIQRFTLPPGHGRLVGVAVSMTAFAPCKVKTDKVCLMLNDPSLQYYQTRKTFQRCSLTKRSVWYGHHRRHYHFKVRFWKRSGIPGAKSSVANSQKSQKQCPKVQYLMPTIAILEPKTAIYHA